MSREKWWAAGVLLTVMAVAAEVLAAVAEAASAVARRVRGK
jgi:hypothetical protein